MPSCARRYRYRVQTSAPNPPHFLRKATVEAKRLSEIGCNRMIRFGSPFHDGPVASLPGRFWPIRGQTCSTGSAELHQGGGPAGGDGSRFGRKGHRNKFWEATRTFFDLHMFHLCKLHSKISVFRRWLEIHVLDLGAIEYQHRSQQPLFPRCTSFRLLECC